MTSHIVGAILICASTCQPTKIRIGDGDTFLLGMQKGAAKIRILNINTAEIDGKCRYEIAPAFKAKKRLAQLMSGGKVKLNRHGKDKYGRTLATVSVNGRDVGDELVREGLARTWTGRRMPWC